MSLRLMLIAGFTLMALSSVGQDSLWFTRTGRIYFISHTDIIDIDATNLQVGSFLNVNSGEMAFTLLMKSFEFTLPLAEEHFNENYVESDKYPKATFKGKITSFDPSKLLTDTDYTVEVTGDLTIHGMTAKISEKGILRKVDGEIRARSRFEIQLETYRIKIPNIVEDRVAKVIPIDIEMVYKPYGKNSSK